MATRSKPDESDLTFNDIEAMLLREHEKPVEVITDHRLVAGLLFHRYNDGTKRHLRVGGGQPTVIVVNTENWSPVRLDFPVDPVAVELLLRERCLEGTPEMGYTDMKKLRLTERGMRRVLQEWIGGAGIHDFFEAGGSLEMGTGQAHWPRNS